MHLAEELAGQGQATSAAGKVEETLRRRRRGGGAGNAGAGNDNGPRASSLTSSSKMRKERSRHGRRGAKRSAPTKTTPRSAASLSRVLIGKVRTIARDCR